MLSTVLVALGIAAVAFFGLAFLGGCVTARVLGRDLAPYDPNATHNRDR